MEIKNKNVQRLPAEYRAKKVKGKPYRFYGYGHGEVYPGDVFFTLYQGKLLFVVAKPKGMFVPISAYDLINTKGILSFDSSTDYTKPMIGRQKGANGGETGGSLTILNKIIGKYPKSFLPVGNEAGKTLIEKNLAKEDFVTIKLGFFKTGSIKGKKYTLPNTLNNTKDVLLTGQEGRFLEPYFEVATPHTYRTCDMVVTSHDVTIFRRIRCIDDLANLLEDGESWPILSSDQMKVSVSYPYRTIGADWLNGEYEGMQGESYDLYSLYCYFTEESPYYGMSIVNFMQQTMPYYEQYSRLPIPKNLRREDVMYLLPHWFAYDPRNGTYYPFLLSKAHDDGSMFCLNEKWFSLLYEQIRKRNIKEACDLNYFHFRSSKDNCFFNAFTLDKGDLPFVFENALVLSFSTFYALMIQYFDAKGEKTMVKNESKESQDYIPQNAEEGTGHKA